jgi:catechol 1,2-dioxygenase
VGEILRGMGRHPFRPAHTHFIVTAPGFQKLVTHIFVGDDPYITSDTVFGVKATLIGDFRQDADGTWRCPFDFVLAPE